MNIEDDLLKEHSRANSERIAAYVGHNNLRFAQLMKIVFANKKIITQRAAWVMRICAENNCLLINPYAKKLVLNLKLEHLHDAVKRNTMAILVNINIKEDFEGTLLTTCFDLAYSKKEAIAIRALAIQILIKIAKKEPFIKQELKIVLEDIIENNSPALIACIKKAKKELVL
jgi:hypothetical protein